jgi:hypothetical protein
MIVHVQPGPSPSASSQEPAGELGSGSTSSLTGGAHRFMFNLVPRRSNRFGSGLPTVAPSSRRYRPPGVESRLSVQTMEGDEGSGCVRQELARLAEAMRAASGYHPDPHVPPVVLALPFEGSWLAVNTPARRVPSHGTHFLGQTFAIDFAAVDTRRRTAPVWDWRTMLATEPATRFFAFGRPILSPIDGHVVTVHDGEPDHRARRSPLLILFYLANQGSRLRRGLGAVAGNHVILGLEPEGPYVMLAHLRAGSLLVQPGDRVVVGQPIAACGNTGNSTQPHVHVQVAHSADLLAARGLPMAFRNYLAWSKGAKDPRRVTEGIPAHRERVQPLRNAGHS